MGVQLIALHGRARFAHVPNQLERSVFRIVDQREQHPRRREASACFIESTDEIPPGYPLYITTDDAATHSPDPMPLIGLPGSLSYLRPGDIIAVGRDGKRISVKWRHDRPLNSFLLTERCDNYCVMCSQPPKDRQDDHLIAEARETIRLADRGNFEIAFTGGEPTLYGTELIDLLKLTGSLLPECSIHVLSNGRRFADVEFASAWAALQNSRLMVGIPLYGAEPTLHDYVVQARGAFAETVTGLLNLAGRGAAIELRVVIHKQTAGHLVEIATFIARNLPFVNQVALMGLEIMGFARANLEEVWIDPLEYRAELTNAVALLASRGIKTMVYNHQLCLIDREIWPWAVKSISDWKNEYHPECLGCSVRSECGGFFFSSKYATSTGIRAVADRTQPALLDLTAQAANSERRVD